MKIQNSNGVRAVDQHGEPARLGEFNGWEIYPMPMFVTLAQADVAAAADWFVRALGFGIVFQSPAVNGQPALVHLRRSKYQDVLLVPTTEPNQNQVQPSLTISFQSDDVDAIATRARAAGTLGLSAIEGPVETPWNTCDLTVTDPAGHRLVFTSRNTNADPKQVERMRELLEAGRRG